MSPWPPAPSHDREMRVESRRRRREIGGGECQGSRKSTGYSCSSSATPAFRDVLAGRSLVCPVAQGRACLAPGTSAPSKGSAPAKSISILYLSSPARNLNRQYRLRETANQPPSGDAAGLELQTNTSQLVTHSIAKVS